MKRVEIISTCLITGGKTAFVGSVIDLDDGDADAVVAAQRGRFVDADTTKLKDTTKQCLAEADARADAAANPGSDLAALVAKQVQEALSKAKGAAPDAAGGA